MWCLVKHSYKIYIYLILNVHRAISDLTVYYFQDAHESTWFIVCRNARLIFEACSQLLLDAVPFSWFITTAVSTITNHIKYYGFYGLFNDAASSSDYMTSNGTLISRKWIGKDVEGSGRGLIWSIIREYAWKNWRKPREISIRMVGVSAGNETRHLPSKSQKGYSWSHLARSHAILYHKVLPNSQLICLGMCEWQVVNLQIDEKLYQLCSYPLFVVRLCWIDADYLVKMDIYALTCAVQINSVI
jgi:hypothetical protein